MFVLNRVNCCRATPVSLDKALIMMMRGEERYSLIHTFTYYRHTENQKELSNVRWKLFAELILGCTLFNGQYIGPSLHRIPRDFMVKGILL